MPADARLREPRHKPAAAVFRRSDRDNLVTGGDLATDDDVGPQSAAVHESPKHAGVGASREAQTGLAQLDADALDDADAEAPSDEIVQPHAPGDDVAARRGRLERDPGLGAQRLERLRLDQRQIDATRTLDRRWREVAIARETLAGERGDPLPAARYRLPRPAR